MIPPDMQPPKRHHEHHQLFKDEELMLTTAATYPLTNLITKYVPFENTPVIPGSFTAQIYINGTGHPYCSQAIHIDAHGTFYSPHAPTRNQPVCVNAQLDKNTGELVCMWDKPPGQHKIYATYETVSELEIPSTTMPPWH